VTLTKAAIFAAGYFLGARAGRERYAQIVDVAARVSQRLDEFSSRGAGPGRAGGPARERSRA
jgi:hypothetical protein